MHQVEERGKLIFFSLSFNRTNDLAEQLVKWRKRKKLPALRGTGAAATISGAKGLIRQIVMEKGLDPYPEMKRGGMVHPGRSDTQGDNTVEDGNSRSSKENRLETPGREGKRQRRRPEFFGTRQR